MPLLSLSLQDGEPVNTNEKKSHRVLFKDGALFFYRTMQSKKEQDGGEYWCVAKNHVGKAVSRHASLQIAGKTPRLVYPLCHNLFYAMFDTSKIQIEKSLSLAIHFALRNTQKNMRYFI